MPAPTPRVSRYVVSKKSIQAMLDSPIAFHRIFALISGSAMAGLFLSQAFYWSGKSSDPNGWFYKGTKEWEEETGLTRRETDTARRDLKSLGVLEEIKKGVPCRLFYRINFDNLMDLIDQSSLAESAKQGCAEPPNQSGGNSQSITENTSETTTENTNIGISRLFELTPSELKDPIRPTQKEKQAKEKFMLPDWVPMPEWDGWIQMRKQMRKPATPLAQRYAVEELDALRISGENVKEVMRRAIQKNWLSFYAINSNGNNHQAPPEDALARERRKEAERKQNGMAMRQVQR